MIDTVLFDLYETLVTEAHVRPTRAGALGATLGLDQIAYRRAWKARRPRVIVGELSFADALREISFELANRVDEAAVQRICEQRVREKTAACARVDPDVVRLVASLARRGARLGVISNGFSEDVRPWPGCALAPAFRCTVFSCDEGRAKPDPEIYLLAIRRLGARPDTTVYIGDGGDDELSGAQRVGLRAYRAGWFVPESRQPGAWPELIACDDVLRLVEGQTGVRPGSE